MQNTNGNIEETNGQQPVMKTCPFLREECTQDDCALWTTLQIVQVGALGVPQGAAEGMCAFPAQIFIATHSAAVTR